jgi:hypothetical protein
MPILLLAGAGALIWVGYIQIKNTGLFGPLLTGAYLAEYVRSGKSEKCLQNRAHPTRFERVTFAFGGQRPSDLDDPIELARNE